MKFAQILNENGQYDRSINFLDGIKVLPFEGASEGRLLYEKAHYWQALKQMQEKNYTAALSLLKKAKTWPENLGVGKPFNPDERIPNYLIAHCAQKSGDNQVAAESMKAIATYTQNNLNLATPNHLFGLKALQEIAGMDAAKTLLNTLLQTHKDNPTIKWVATQFLGKQKTKEEIQKGVTKDLALVTKIAEL